MFCSNCGTKIQEDSKFCSRCGARIVAVAQTEAGDRGEQAVAPAEGSAEAEVAVASEMGAPEQALGTAEPNPNTRRRIGLLTWLLPTLSLIIAAALIGSTYMYQMSVNRQVDHLLQTGETLALDGKLAEGKAVIEEALHKRPDHRVLLADRDLLSDAIDLQTRLSDTAGQLKNKKFDDALKEIDKLKAELAARSGPVFEKLASSADERQAQIVVAQVNDSVPAKKTVEELVPLLNTVRDYKSEEAKKSTKQILQKIADISYDKASAELADKQFAKALSTLEEALKYDEANEKLATLKAAVEEQKQAFEEAENRRIQQAIEAATQEDTKNRTEAVELVSIDAYTDADGNFVVEGSVKNKATRSISYVVLYLDILDTDGNTVDQEAVYVSPNILDVGETGTFYDSYYNFGSMSSVNVTSAEWYLN